MVILAGGLGTRLRPLTERLPKCMVPVGDKPFLEHQIDLLRRSGIRDIVLCVGYLGEAVLERFGDGHRLGVHLSYSWERQQLLGMAGALKNAGPLLDREFFVTYGDAYLLLDYKAIMRRFRQLDCLGLMVVYRNHNRLQPSNVDVREGKVASYSKERSGGGMVYVDEGLSVLRKRALKLIPEDVPYSQEEFYAELIRRDQLQAYETPQRFYEIGSPQGLAEFQHLMAAGGLP
ncbi:MAG: nucleotidyltransferase family protein [Dehalococcoidia bacterium]